MTSELARAFRLFAGCCLVMLSIGVVCGQNLVPNPGFESYTDCPTGVFTGYGALPCAPWRTPTSGTSDYFNACNVGEVGVPDNFFGSRTAHSGNGYCGGFYHLQSSPNYREYLQVQLTESLVVGKFYEVRLFYANSEQSCPTNRMGVYFSEDQITNPPGYVTLPVTPQVEADMGLLGDTSWSLFSGCYMALGGEEWITIGNFYDDAETEVSTDCFLFFGSSISYVFIDDVSVEEVQLGGLIFSLGEDVTACESFTIHAPVDDAQYLWQDNSTGQELVVTQSGVYAVTISKDCELGADSIEVIITSDPGGVELGDPEQFMCPGDQIVFNLDPSLGDYHWQDNTISSSYQVTTPGIYAVTLVNPCAEYTDSVQVTALMTPEIIDLGPDTLLCGKSILDISLDPLSGTFMWQDGSSDPYYVIYEPGVYSVEVSNVCGSVSDDIVVTYGEDPQVAFDQDSVTFCPAEGIAFHFDPDVGNYIWSDGFLGPDHVISVPGSYAVSVVNDCGSAQASIVLLPESAPVLSLGPDLTVCPGQLPLNLAPVTFSDVDVWQWSDGSTGMALNVVNPGSYAVTVSNSCFSVSDTINVFVDNVPPQIALPPDTVLCPGDVFVIDLALSGADVMWEDGAQTSVYEISQSGVYRVTVSNSCGQDSDEIAVDFLDAITPPDLGPDRNICPGESVTFEAGILGVDYLWQDGSVLSSFTTAVADTVVLTVSNACEVYMDTVIVAVDGSAPDAGLPATLGLCEGEMVTFGTSVAGAVYLWNTGSMTGSIDVTTPGTYILTVSNACGVDIDSTVVLDLGSVPILDLGGDIRICPGDLITLEPEVSGVSYFWQDGSSDPTFQISGEGVIVLTVSNACGMSSDTLLVTEDANGPSLELGEDISVCEGEIVLISPGVNGVQYLWQDGSTAQEFIATESATVILEISNACGIARDTIEILISGSAPVVDLGPDVLLCDGEEVVLYVDKSSQIMWQDGSSEAIYLVDEAGTYSVLLTNTCGSAADTIMVAQGVSPDVFDLGPDQEICAGESVELNGPTVPSGDILSWSTGSADQSIVVEGGTYVLSVSNLCGTVADTVHIEQLNASLTQPAPLFSEICDGEHVLLDAGQQGLAQYTWSTGEQSASIEATSAGVYSVTVTSACAELKADLEVVEGDCFDPHVFVPNVFSPNGDGVNDEFKVSLDPQDLAEFYLRVYDRWGEEVFVSGSPDIGWRGDLADRPMAPGVYVYTLLVSRIGSLPRMYSGDITLVR